MLKRMAAPFVVLAALLAVRCGSSSSPTSSSSTTTSSGQAADLVITIIGIDGGMSFSPDSATVASGQTVAWRNADVITHDVAQDAQGGFDTGPLSGGTTSNAIKMTTPGSLPYHCSIHPSMVGTLTVTQ